MEKTDFLYNYAYKFIIPYYYMCFQLFSENIFLTEKNHINVVYNKLVL